MLQRLVRVYTCQIVGNLMHWLKFLNIVDFDPLSCEEPANMDLQFLLSNASMLSSTKIDDFAFIHICRADGQ